MEKINYPLIYILEAKRGNSYNKRRFEIHQEALKYYDIGKEE